jgi:ABC-type multidrug transport system fused ATPase/permease subunit
VQTSALDCGPAALGAALAGFGIHPPFDRLRDACRTGRDGTSIDALEETAGAFGLEAEQLLIPGDHLGLPEAGCAPCILVVLEPGGATHFVTLWRLHRRRVQLMDPAAGRRWPAVAALERTLYRHRTQVPVAAWRAWAESDGLQRPLDARLAALGLPLAERRRLLHDATAAASWWRLAALDAACRFTHQLAAAGAVRRGRDAGRVLGALLDRADERAGVVPAVIPLACWSARPALRAGDGAGGDDGAERVLVEGAVMVRLRRRADGFAAASAMAAARRGWTCAATVSHTTARGDTPRRSGRSAAAPVEEPVPPLDRPAVPVPDRAAVPRLDRSPAPRLDRPAVPPVCAAAASSGAAGGSLPRSGRDAGSWPGPAGSRLRRAADHLPLLAGAAILAGLRLLETAALAATLEILPGLGSPRLRLGGLAALAILAAAILVAEQGTLRASQAAGRRAEIQLRLGLAAKLPRLADRYLRTRLPADLAERAHLLERTRRGPELTAGAARAAFEGALAAVAIAWLDPRLGPLAATLALGAVAAPLLLLPWLEERNRRWRAHAAALGGLYLDVLRGRAAVQAHSAGESLRRRHDERLAGWLRARRAAAAAQTQLETGVQILTGAGGAALVLAHAGRHGAGPSLLLVAVWAAQLAGAGQRLAHLAAVDLPLHRTLRRRFQEILDAEEDEPPVARAAAAGGGRSAGAPCRAAAPASPRATAGAAEAAGAAALRAASPAAGGATLVLHDLGVEIDGHWLLRHLDLTIPAGQHVALLGPSGAGKSTLLGTLLGWHRPAAGCVTFDGSPLGSAVGAEIRRTTAWAGPEVTLWQGPLLANLCYGLGAPATVSRHEPQALGEATAGAGAAGDLAPIDALRAADLLDLVERLPQGLQTPLGESGGVLSGGEQQRLRFARALLRPGVRLVLLDEPWRGLGAGQRRALLAAGRARWRRATVLCVTHSPAEALGFDRIVVLDHGRLVEDGEPRALANRGGSRFRAMLDAEEELTRALAGPPWRRLHLARGQIREQAPPRAATRPVPPADAP